MKPVSSANVDRLTGLLRPFPTPLDGRPSSGKSGQSEGTGDDSTGLPPHENLTTSGARAKLDGRAGHDFAASLAIGQALERDLDALFVARGWDVAQATDEEQRAGLDRWLTKDGQRRSVEYKADMRADSTGNYALELVGALPDDGGPAKVGWGINTPADFVVLYRPTSRVAHILRGGDLRRYVSSVMDRFRVAAVRNATWWSLVLLAPVGTVDALAIQRLEVSP